MGSTSGIAGTLDVSIVGTAGAASIAATQSGAWTVSGTPYPAGATPQAATSYQVANAAANAAIPAAAGKYSYLTTAFITAAGAAAGANVQGTITGINPTPMAFSFTFPAGALVAATPLALNFNPPLQSSAQNTQINVYLPAGGAGNTSACVSVAGYQL